MTVLEALAARLAMPGWEVLPGWQLAEPAEGRLRRPPHGPFQRVWWSLQATGQVLRRAWWIARHRPDVVSIHAADRPAMCLLAARLALTRRCYLSWHTSGTPLPGPKLLRRLAARLASGVILVSPEAAAQAEREGIPSRKVLCIAPGVPIPPPHGDAHARARAAYGLPPDGFVLLSAGRLVEAKGFSDLIRTLPDLPDARLVVAGEGPEKETLRMLAESLAPGRVVFSGWLDRRALDGLYAAADVFVLPSRRDAFGTVYIEAAMHGLPSVACDVDGVRETVLHGQTGLLVPAGDVAALTLALGQLQRDRSLLRALGEAARERAIREFTEDRMVSEYKRALGPQPWRPAP